MPNFTKDEIYGVSFEEYCHIHNRSPDEIIQKAKVDYFLLKTRLHHLVWHAPQSARNDELIKAVKDKMEAKRKHIERLKEWKG